MRDGAREVTTFCPRCGRPIVWSVARVPFGADMEVAGRACQCPLSDDEWDDLAEQAEAVLEGRTG